MAKRGVLTSAERVRPGDAVWNDGTFVVVTKVRRAQGRKPRSGENLHFVTEEETVRVNSRDPVRIRRGPA